MEPELREKLILLFHEQPNLFEAINLTGVKEREEILRDGESALIEIEGKTYRFGLDEVSEYVGDDVYDL